MERAHLRGWLLGILGTICPGHLLIAQSDDQPQFLFSIQGDPGALLAPLEAVGQAFPYDHVQYHAQTGVLELIGPGPVTMEQMNELLAPFGWAATSMAIYTTAQPLPTLVTGPGTPPYPVERTTADPAAAAARHHLARTAWIAAHPGAYDAFFGPPPPKGSRRTLQQKAHE